MDIVLILLHAVALLRAIADKLIPGLPDNLRILLVSQIDDEEEGVVVSGEAEETQHDPDLTVTERVVKSDRRRERSMMEQQRLSIYLSCELHLIYLPILVLLKAYESTSPSAIAEAVFSIRLFRAEDELKDAHKISLKRSGTRGSEARKQLLKAEATVTEYKEKSAVQLNSSLSISRTPCFLSRLANAHWGIDDTQIALEATELLSHVQSTLDSVRHLAMDALSIAEHVCS